MKTINLVPAFTVIMFVAVLIMQFCDLRGQRVRYDSLQAENKSLHERYLKLLLEDTAIFKKTNKTLDSVRHSLEVCQDHVESQIRRK